MLQRSGFPSALNSVRISKGPRGRDKITGSLKRSLMTGVFTKHGQRTEKPFQIVSWATNITNRRLGSGRAAWWPRENALLATPADRSRDLSYRGAAALGTTRRAWKSMTQTLSSCNPTTCQFTSQPTQGEAGEPQGSLLGPQNRGEEDREGKAWLSGGGEKAPAYCGSIRLESLTARMHLCITVCHIHTLSDKSVLNGEATRICNCLSRNILYNEENMFHSCKNKHISVSCVFHMATGSLCFNLSRLIFIFQQQKHTIIAGLSLLAFLLEQITCIKIDLK